MHKGKLTLRTYFSNFTHTNRKCWIYTPPNYNPELTYPILYLLHGIGGMEDEWLEANPNELIDEFYDQKVITQPPIIVIPNVRAAIDDSVPPQDQMLSTEHIKAFDDFIVDLKDSLIPFAESEYPVSYCSVPVKNRITKPFSPPFDNPLPAPLALTLVCLIFF